MLVKNFVLALTILSLLIGVVHAQEITVVTEDWPYSCDRVLLKNWQNSFFKVL